MTDERLSFDDAWKEAMDIIHEQALVENELFDVKHGKED